MQPDGRLVDREGLPGDGGGAGARGRPVLAATASATVPLPLPLAPLVTVIHEAVLDAVQAQPAGLVTATLVGFTGRHGARRARVDRVGAPRRGLVDGEGLAGDGGGAGARGVTVLAATARATVPLPLPLAPLVTVIHDAVLDAVQAHPVGLVTATLADCPAATALVEPGLMA